MNQEMGGQVVEAKAEKKQKRAILKKIDIETAKSLAQIKDRANRKQFGRKVKDAEIIRVALKLIGAEEIAAMQETTYSERDRLQMVHDAFQKEHGRISLDQFIGKLMRGEVSAKTK